MTPEEAARARRRMRRRIGTLARSGVRVAGAGIGAMMGEARRIGDASVERLRARRERRRQAAGRDNRTPLPSLFDLHPEARHHMRREIGLRSIPIDEIAGTAVAGPAQRGSDFQPMPSFRSMNWEARWQRINRAVDRLEILPPIDVLHSHGRYWVEDGHNRVAAALRNGQVEIDAAVTELRPPNAPIAQRADAPALVLAPVLDTSHELRAAGEGRFSVGAASLATGDEAPHAHGDDDAEHGRDDEPEAEPTAQPRRRPRTARRPPPT